MTTQEKVIRNKMSLLELAEYLKNVSEACRVMGVSRQHFYDIKTAYEDGGAEALREKSRRKPNIKNRTAPEVEKAICELALEQPAYGQLRVSNELRKKGILISPAGVRSVWTRHDLETTDRRVRQICIRPASRIGKTGGFDRDSGTDEGLPVLKFAEKIDRTPLRRLTQQSMEMARSSWVDVENSAAAIESVDSLPLDERSTSDQT